MYFNQMEFGQRVKALRKENGLTLQQMADELNLSYEHYKKIENGAHGCSIMVLLDISSFFDVSTDYLLTGRSFESLHIQKQLSEAQAILADIAKGLK
ncbi:MAG: helix-turn-helix transcriptional regulator [Clostridia bacterium]|nr:helix-turn-helix transcriptional regulator [Clostridia bacterium]